MNHAKMVQRGIAYDSNELRSYKVGRKVVWGNLICQKNDTLSRQIGLAGYVSGRIASVGKESGRLLDLGEAYPPCSRVTRQYSDPIKRHLGSQ